MRTIGNRKRLWLDSDEMVNKTSTEHPPAPVTFYAKPQNLTLDLERSAIVIVDMQNDFCSPGGWLESIGVTIRLLTKGSGGL